MTVFVWYKYYSKTKKLLTSFTNRCIVQTKNNLKRTIFAAISSSIDLAAFTPIGSPSIRTMSLFSLSGGMIIDVPVSVFIRLTATTKC